MCRVFSGMLNCIFFSFPFFSGYSYNIFLLVGVSLPPNKNGFIQQLFVKQINHAMKNEFKDAVDN